MNLENLKLFTSTANFKVRIHHYVFEINTSKSKHEIMLDLANNTSHHRNFYL